MGTRIPQPEDFTSIKSKLDFILVYPEVPETTTAILILFHGLGDSEAPFADFAKNIALPGVLSIAVRGISPLPPALLGLSDSELSSPTKHFHWGDDLALDSSTGELDPDPGFTKARDLVLGKLVQEILIDTCGWSTRDILLFGFGQGGTLALGLASRLRSSPRVVDISEGDNSHRSGQFKGVISIGGPMPSSMMVSGGRSATPVLMCHGRMSEAVDADALAVLSREFANVRDGKWRKEDDGMPRNRDEMLPIMQFFAERLQANQ
jgi:predicted esterase